jgi:hypothetical protein
MTTTRKGRARLDLDERLICNMRKGCFSQRQIANVMRCSDATIRTILKRHGVEPRIGLSKMRNCKTGIKEIYAATLKRRFSWLPDEYRADYFSLTANGKMPAAEAKAIILNQIEVDRACSARAAA